MTAPALLTAEQMAVHRKRLLGYLPVNEHTPVDVTARLELLRHIDALEAREKKRDLAVRAVLLDCEDYFDQRADVIDAPWPEPPGPNEAMQMLERVRSILRSGEGAAR